LPASERQVLPELPRQFALVTLHRPANVDDPVWLGKLLNDLQTIHSRLAVVFPVHPRTRLQIAKLGHDSSSSSGLLLLDPLPYLTFLALQRRATAVITDSGGIQEETTYLGTPCLTLRENTERPITVEIGTNILLGRNTSSLLLELEAILAGQGKTGAIPPLWDGRAAERIAKIILHWGAQKELDTPSVLKASNN
jgi:UDP-N-acetylglucosamine 2-epimerase (non-hydrolysing)